MNSTARSLLRPLLLMVVCPLCFPELLSRNESPASFCICLGDSKRLTSPRQIQKLAGLSLRENSSGKHKGQTTISKRGRSKLRAVLFNAAIPLIATNPEFKSLHEYYTTRANNPLKKKQSVIAISCKLIRVFYAILANGVTYDAQKMLSDIHRQPQAA